MKIKSILRWKAVPGDQSAQVAGVGGGMHTYNIKGLPLDVLEHVFHSLDARDVFALAASCKLLRDVASSPRIWADLTQRTFLFEELPQDLEFLSSQSTALIRGQFWQLTRQRPAFLSDAPRTSEIVEHAGSRFRKVLHIDGRRDFNFTTVFRDVPAGQYNVVWRLMLQPGYIRGYCNFRAVFSRPADPKAAAAAAAAGRSPAKAPRATGPVSSISTALRQRLLCRATAKPGPEATMTAAAGALRRLAAWGPVRRRGRLSGSPATVAPLDAEDPEDPFPNPAVAPQPGLREQLAMADPPAQPRDRSGLRALRLRRRLRWLPPCRSPAAAAASAPAAHSDGSGGSRRRRDSRVGSAGGSLGGVGQRAVPAPEAVAGPYAASAAAPPPSSRSPSASAATSPHQARQHPSGSPQQPLPPHHHHQQQQQQQQQPLQPHASPQATAARLHPQVPEIEPEDLAPPPPPPPAAPGPAPGHQLPPPPPPPRQPQAQQPQPLLQRQSAVQRGPQAQLQRAMGQLANASAKRDAALAAAGGPRYVPRWLSPLWGGHASSWRQLDPAGPLGHGAWRNLHMGTLTLRRTADAHLHGVMVQLRPANAAQLEAALPAGETRWRGALVDYVELVPVHGGGKLLGGLLPSFLQRGSPVLPEGSDLVEVPRL